MKTDHLSAWEQEEYILNQGTDPLDPQARRHLGECGTCRAKVARLEHGVAIFRDAAVDWSSHCLAARPQRLSSFSLRRFPIVPLRLGLVAAVPFLLLLLALLPFHLFHLSGRQMNHPVAQTSTVQNTDDALLEQVEEQVSVAVPSSMESLTHLVSADNAGAATAGSKQIVQTN